MSASLRVVLVLGSSAGGVGTHVRSIAERFAGLGHDVLVAGPEATDEQFGFSGAGPAENPVRFAALPVPASLSPRDLRSVRRLRELLAGGTDSEHTDIVHAHGFRAGLLAVLAAGRRGGRRRAGGVGSVVVTWHNAVLGAGARAWASRRIEKYLARSADMTLGASDDLVRRAEELGAPAARLAPVAAPERGGPGGDPDAPEGLAERAVFKGRLLAETGLPASTRIVLTVGRVAPQKNYDLLLAAAALWRDRHPDAVSLIAGGADARELARLQARVDAEKLPVRFLGARDDVGELYRAAEIFLLTSHWEARALVVQEAMTAGLAVVATAVGGLPELLGPAGVLVPAGDAGALADAVANLLDDAPLRSVLGASAQARAAGFPGEDEVAANLVGIYRACLTETTSKLG